MRKTNAYGASIGAKKKPYLLFLGNIPGVRGQEGPASSGSEMKA